VDEAVNETTDDIETIRLDPKYAYAYNFRGNVYYLRNNLDRAIADYNEAIRHDPKYAFAYFNRGNAYAIKKDYDRFIADYTESIRLNPKFVFAYYNRGAAYYDIKDYNHAIADYSEAIRLEIQAYFNRYSAFNKKDSYDSAIASLGYLLKKDNDHLIYKIKTDNKGLDKEQIEFEVQMEQITDDIIAELNDGLKKAGYFISECRRIEATFNGILNRLRIVLTGRGSLFETGIASSKVMPILLFIDIGFMSYYSESRPVFLLCNDLAFMSPVALAKQQHIGNLAWELANGAVDKDLPFAFFADALRLLPPNPSRPTVDKHWFSKH